MKIEIDIDNYISEEEKHEIARQAFRDTIVKNFKLDGDPKKELMRIIGNEAYYFVKQEIEKVFDKNIEKLLADAIIKILGDDNSIRFDLFYRGDYGEPEGIGRTLIKKYVKEHESDIARFVENSVRNFDYDKEVAAQVSVCINKLADKFYDLSDSIGSFLNNKKENSDG